LVRRFFVHHVVARARHTPVLWIDLPVYGRYAHAAHNAQCNTIRHER
jgi:hypothetical protein